jgi:hypothetical protein
MSNKRISDLPNSTPLKGTEALVTDQESTVATTGIDTVQTTLSSIQEFTLSAAPFLEVIGGAEFKSGVDMAGNLDVTGDVTVSGTLTVEGISEFNSDVSVFSDLYIEDSQLIVTDGQMLSGLNGFETPLEDIFAYKGQYILNGGGVEFIQRLTQAQYDAIGTPDPLVLYIIVG